MKQKYQTKGFTILETLVAILILFVVISAGFGVVKNGLNSLLSARDRVTAFFLAQEATEFVKNWRTENSLYTSDGWDSGFYNCFDGCSLDVIANDNNIERCTSESCQIVYEDESGWYRQNQSGTPTRFNRLIKITKVNTEEAHVDVTVSWVGNGGGSLSVREYIYDWK